MHVDFTVQIRGLPMNMRDDYILNIYKHKITEKNKIIKYYLWELGDRLFCFLTLTLSLFSKFSGFCY